MFRNEHSNFRRVATPALIALTALVFAGCATRPDYTKIRPAWEKGDLQTASVEVQRDAGYPVGQSDKVDGSKDPLRWMLNAGSITGVNGEFAASAHYLDVAQAKIDEGTRREDDEKSVSDRAKNLLFGDYEPTIQEAVMVPVLQIYNALGTGSKVDEVAAKAKALVEAQKTMIDRKRRTEDAFVAESAEPEEITLTEKLKLTLSPRADAEESLREMGYTDADLMIDVPDAEKRSLYVNPYARWLAAVIIAHSAKDPSDFELAAGQLESALDVLPDNMMLQDTLRNYMEAALSSTLSEANAIAFSDDPAEPDAAMAEPNLTYVVYEGGHAPAIGMKPVDLKVPKALNLAVGGLVTLAANLAATHGAGHIISTEYALAATAAMTDKATGYLPVLESRGKAPALLVNGFEPTPLADFDVLMDRRLRAETIDYATAFTYEIIGRVVGRGIAIGASLATLTASLEGGNALVANISARAFIASVALAAQPLELSKPGTRTWNYMPRTISVSRFATPAGGKIDVGGESVSVPAKGVNIVRVYKADKYWPAVVQVFTLKPDGTVSAAPVKRLSAPPRPAEAPAANARAAAPAKKKK
ncbi:MAG: hypothetical protein ACI4QA_01075 [Candidatus Spyradosoma sp.]